MRIGMVLEMIYATIIHGLKIKKLLLSTTHYQTYR